MLKRLFSHPLMEKLNNAIKNAAVGEGRKRSAEEASESTTMTSSSTVVAAETAVVEPKRARRAKNVKYAMLLAYQGQNYFGMQYQRKDKEFPTIESHLMAAMLKHGFINDEHMDDLFPWHFQRAARTDRSVSAVRQICSMFLPMDQHFIDNGPALMNSCLPEDIHVFSIRRVTPSFHAQKFCDARTYSYTMPSFALAPCDQLTTADYRVPEERLEELRELLKCFVGSHNFYNYTSRLEHNDQRVIRTILEVRCEKPFLFTDPLREKPVEFLSIYIQGRSFMMHQIRKMIGAVLAILRGFMYKSDIARSFQQQRMDIPRAPGLGLLLERLHYDRFEQRYGKSHGSLNELGAELDGQIVEWRNRWIVARILAEECRTQTMMHWLSSLPVHAYMLDPEDESGLNVSIALPMAAKNALGLSKLTNDDEDLGEGDEPVLEAEDGEEAEEIGAKNGGEEEQKMAAAAGK